MRVTRGPVLILTCDPEALDLFFADGTLRK
jgi:hypothetical protein